MPESALANRNATQNRLHDPIPAKSHLALLRKGFSNPNKPTLNDRGDGGKKNELPRLAEGGVKMRIKESGAKGYFLTAIARQVTSRAAARLNPSTIFSPL